MDYAGWQMDVGKDVEDKSLLAAHPKGALALYSRERQRF